MLTREFIESPAFERLKDSIPASIRWSAQQVQSSMEATMAKRPPGSGVWLFGYGSLIWNPTIEFVERRRALISGWQRAFAHRMVAGRGSAEHPGRMLGLAPGGETTGVAFRIAEPQVRRELTVVWSREMLTGAYTPTWTSATFQSGDTQQVLVFVSDQGCATWERDWSVKTVAPLIAKATGPIGSNASYVTLLAAALEELGTTDQYVVDLVGALIQDLGLHPN